ncbi:hypothetical protein [uncultured Microscilla sp.]|uniref:hypothetical protein n=1 Tax=uncultured Microscilla sp. TaxID=432653 RepID=UPI00261768F9|nr:hypothetical protein [uncultured Microscilla sp.]
MEEVNNYEPFYEVRLEIEENNFCLYKFYDTQEEAKQAFKVMKQFIPDDESPTKISLIHHELSPKTGVSIKETTLKTYKLRDQEGEIVKLTKRDKADLLKERYEELKERLSSRK